MVGYTEGILQGINSTIFAYGQTGSGKTYTIFGPSFDENTNATEYQNELKGIIPRALDKLFNSLDSNRDGYTLYTSLIQIYNEQLYDLLQDDEAKRPLRIREGKQSGIFVEGLTEYVVDSVEDAIALVIRGNRNRKTRQTRMNINSSRSHTILQILAESNMIDKKGFLSKGKLSICDLAGSEKIKGNEGMLESGHLEELKRINHSLSTLSKVISCLSSNKLQTHIPYREAKLTRLLQDSLGVNARTGLIATISPSNESIEESISTLKFALSAKKIKITVKVNEINAVDKQMLVKLKQEVEFLKSLLYKGNHPKELQNMHQQLINLQAENEQLKSITAIQEVENLKQENKVLRIELQQLKGPGSELINCHRDISRVCTSQGLSDTNEEMRGTNIEFFKENQIKMPSTAKETNKIHIVIPETAKLNNARLDKSNAVLSLKGLGQININQIPLTEIKQILEQHKQSEITTNAALMQEGLVQKGRCPLCTLVLPCKHYKNPEEMENWKNKSLCTSAQKQHSPLEKYLRIETPKNNVTVVDTCEMKNQNDGLQSASIPKAIKTTNDWFIKRRQDTSVRIRIRDNSTQHTRGPINQSLREASENKKRNEEVKKATEKLKVLKKIEQFKERQLKTSMDILLEQKKQYEEDLKNTKAKVIIIQKIIFVGREKAKIQR